MRIYHWGNSLVVSLILITVVLRKTIFDDSELSLRIFKFFESSEITINKDKSLELASDIAQSMWNWHYYFGFALAALIIYRIALFFTKSGQSVILDAFSVLKKEKKNDYWIKMLYLAVYTSIFIMALTGVLMYFYTDLGFSEETRLMMENLHVGVMNVIVYFIPFHIIGVVLAENEDQQGITSDMINGGKTK